MGQECPILVQSIRVLPQVLTYTSHWIQKKKKKDTQNSKLLSHPSLFGEVFRPVGREFTARLLDNP